MSAARTLQLARERMPNLLILDISRPTATPEALAAGLRIAYGPALPILAMSTDEGSGRAAAIQAYALLKKPFDVSELLRLVRYGLTLHRGVA
jgi:DNA-binding response OmpR family regulator